MTEKCGCGCVSGCRHAPMECSGEAVTVERPHGMRVPLCEICVMAWGVTLVNGSTAQDAADGKRQAEIALENLRRSGGAPKDVAATTKEARAAAVRRAIDGVALAIGKIPYSKTQDALDYATIIEATFWAMVRECGAPAAIEAVRPILERHRLTMLKSHVTDGGRLKRLEQAIEKLSQPAPDFDEVAEAFNKLADAGKGPVH